MTANQGVKPVDFYTGFQKLLVQATYLREEQVILWFGDERPALGMADFLVWFSPSPEIIDKADGPGRYGNKFSLSIDVHLLSRNFEDPSQGDTRRILAHELYRWRMLDSIQNEVLFSDYVATRGLSSVWLMPLPESDATQLSIGTMQIENIQIKRTQGEEGTLESSFTVSIPAVLSLTLPQSHVD